MNKFLAVILFTLASLLPSILAGDVSSLISPSMFNEMLKHRNDGKCQGNGFYTYNAFINAARSFDAFGTTGDINTRKRELAAFFGQTSHQTTGKLLLLLPVCTCSIFLCFDFLMPKFSL